MSAMGSQRRRLSVGPKPNRRYLNNNKGGNGYVEWLAFARAQLNRLFNPRRFARHPSHRRILFTRYARQRGIFARTVQTVIAWKRSDS